jgi:hypothetical protein
VPETTATVSPSPNLLGWITTAPTVTLVATDTAFGGAQGSGVRWTFYRIGSVTTTYGAPFTVSAAGTTTVEFWSIDYAGNREDVRSVQMRTDPTGPQVTDDRLASYSGVLDSVLTLSAADPESLVSSLEFSVDGAVAQVLRADPPTSTLRASLPLTFNRAHTVTYAATNGAGTRSTGVLSTLGGSKTATSITIKSSTSRPWRKRSFTLSGLLTRGKRNDRCVVEVRKPGSTLWTRLSSRKAGRESRSHKVPWSYSYKTSTKGTYTFRVRYYGDAARFGCTSRTITLKVK